jgi:hypothetical protein
MSKLVNAGIQLRALHRRCMLHQFGGLALAVSSASCSRIRACARKDPILKKSYNYASHDQRRGQQ